MTPGSRLLLRDSERSSGTELLWELLLQVHRPLPLALTYLRAAQSPEKNSRPAPSFCLSLTHSRNIAYLPKDAPGLVQNRSEAALGHLQGSSRATQDTSSRLSPEQSQGSSKAASEQLYDSSSHSMAALRHQDSSRAAPAQLYYSEPTKGFRTACRLRRKSCRLSRKWYRLSSIRTRLSPDPDPSRRPDAAPPTRNPDQVDH